MLPDSKSGITVQKTLHMENATVLSVAYTSLSRPSMVEAVQVGEDILIRKSDDGGKTWREHDTWPHREQGPDGQIRERTAPYYYLDPDNGLLVEYFIRYEAEEWALTFGPDPEEEEPLEFRTRRICYRISSDEGATWGPEKQLIQNGSSYDEKNWCRGVYHGRNGVAFGPFNITKLANGVMVFPVWMLYLDEDGVLQKWPDRFAEPKCSMSSACLLGRWNTRRDDIEWELSEALRAPEWMSHAVDEPSVALLDDGRLLMVMRGCMGPQQLMPSVRFFSLSKDVGSTWAPIVPLTYPDCSYVYSPSSISWLFRSSKNGRIYLVANILPEPTRLADPRYPLQIAEIDRKYLWVIPDTITVIDDRQPHHPGFVRFSNWAQVEDRETGDLTLYMTEARVDAIIPDTPGTISPHSFRYDIGLPCR